MNNIVKFNRSAKLVQEKIVEMLLIVKGLFIDKFPGQDFDIYVWNIEHLKNQSSSATNPNLYFTTYGTLDNPLPKKFVEVVKSWLLLELGDNVKSLVYRLDAVRILWEAVKSRRGGNADSFDWSKLSEADISKTEELMKGFWKSSTTYKRMTNILGFVRFLERRSLIFPINYKIQTPRVEDTNRFTIEGQENTMSKLPTTRALEGLADIYSTLAVEPSDRLLICLTAIITATGYRITELLTLPLDCEIEETRGGKLRYGLRFYKRKAKSSARQFEIRWVTPKGAELVKKAVAEIKEITAPFREQAKLLEQDPKRFPLVGYQWNQKLSPQVAADLIGFKNVESLYQAMKNRRQDGKSFYYLAGDISNYLFSRRVKRLWTLDRNDGTHQMLSETLLIAPKNFFHGQRGTIKLLIEPLTVGYITDFLTGKSGAKSVFERFNIKEPDGSFCKITSHQFRHWLNTIAVKGGLPMEILSRWMGRDNPSDTEAYIHLTQEEKIEWVKKGIREDTTKGILNDAFNSLPVDERDLFLDGQIQAAHFTHLGVCVHDFAVSPCKYHLNCVKGCPDYLRNKGDQRERQQLVQIKSRTQKALEDAELAKKMGTGIKSESWVNHHVETLNGINKALSIDDELNSEPSIEGAS